jgi:hypothetical protein
MAQFVIVHRANTKEEVLLNLDFVIEAYREGTIGGAGNPYTVVELSGANQLSIEEPLTFLTSAASA